MEIDSRRQAYFGERLRPLHYETTHKVLTAIEASSTFFDLARTYCKGPDVEAALRRLVEALKDEAFFHSSEKYKAHEHAQRVLRGEV